MTTLSYVLPTPGTDLNSIADPELVTALVSIRAWANGFVDDSNLANPNNGVRRLLLQATGRFGLGFPVAGDFLLAAGGGVASGSLLGAAEPPIWVGDAGYSSQPADFQVAGKSAFCRVKMMMACNTAVPGVTVTGKLYTITSVGGVAGNIAFSFTPLAGSSTPAVAPGAGVVSILESGQFAMPLSGPYALGFALSGTPAANTMVTLTAQLFGYNA